MPVKSTRLFTLLLGLVALVLVFSLFRSSDMPSSAATQLEQNDWSIDQARAWHLQPDQTQHYMQAQRLRQQHDTIFAEQPRVFITKTDQNMVIRSEQLTLTEQQHYAFKKQIHIQHHLHSAEKIQINQFRTEQLDYNQNTALLTSPVAVKFTTSLSQTQGVGLQIDLNSQRTQIHSQVTTLYEIH